MYNISISKVVTTDKVILCCVILAGVQTQTIT